MISTFEPSDFVRCGCIVDRREINHYGSCATTDNMMIGEGSTSELNLARDRIRSASQPTVYDR
jgi:hypothetical protein